MVKEIKVLIVEEDQAIRERLTTSINKAKRGFKVCGEASDLLEGLKQVARLSPDLLILDVDIPGGSGFDMLDCISGKDLPVIFLSESGDHAIRAFRYQAVDFLLKPLDAGFTLAALEKAKTKVWERKGLAYPEKKTPPKLAIHSQNETEYVEIRSIVRLEASGCYSHLYLECGRKITATKALREFEDLLSGNDFTRVHNSHVINMRHIKKFIRKDGLMVRMTDNYLVPIAVRRKNAFEEHLNKVAI